MSSFFSDDDDEPTPQRRQPAPRGRSGRAAPRLARHLRNPDERQPNARASSSTLPSSPPGHGMSLFDRTRGDSEVTGLTDWSGRKTFVATAGFDVGHVPLDDFPAPLPVPAPAPPVDDTPASDFSLLIRAWTRERGTPDIQPWQGDLVEECLHKLAQQGEMLDLLRGDPKTSEEEHFKLIVVQTEMERVRFVVRAYLRCRLAKVRAPSESEDPERKRRNLPGLLLVLGGKVRAIHYGHARRATPPLATRTIPRRKVGSSPPGVSVSRLTSRQIHPPLAHALHRIRASVPAGKAARTRR